MTRSRTLIATILTVLIAGTAPFAAAVPASAQLGGKSNVSRGWGLGPDLLLRRDGDRRNGAPTWEAAAASCSGAAAKAAAQTGGQVLSVSSRQQGGQTVCVVTLLVPGKEGGRPRKTTVTIRP